MTDNSSYGPHWPLAPAADAIPMNSGCELTPLKVATTLYHPVSAKAGFVLVPMLVKVQIPGSTAVSMPVPSTVMLCGGVGSGVTPSSSVPSGVSVNFTLELTSLDVKFE